MKTKPIHLKVVSVSLFIFLFITSTGEAFDNKAHEALSERATTISNLDNFLKTVLSFEFSDGINQSLEGKLITRHIQDGALLEDSIGLGLRVKNHFHNPKLSWDQAGLRPPGSSIPIGYSSIVWSQLQNQGDLGNKSWHQARDAYFTALTSTSQSERKKWYATTFRLLGHAIHHVQDAAVPSHTRNDAHFSLFGIGNKDLFHSFAERPEILALINTISPSPIDASFLSNRPSADSRYPIPISRFIDTTAGDIAALALGNGTSIGIAEYSNANFFSDDTIFPETFAYPGLSNLLISTPELDPQTGTKKTYLFFKPGFGERNYRLAQASSLRNITGTNVATDIGLDYKVFTDYAYKLFPRAIGYSAGLIDYFFRAQVDTADPPLGYVLVPWEARPSSIDVQGVKVIGDGQQTGNGTIQMVLLHENSFRGLRNPPTSPGPKPLVVVSNEVPFTISSQGQTVTFPFAALPWPTEVIPALCCYGNGYMGIIVYRGTLGQETNTAVVAGGYCHDLESGDKWERFYSFENATLDGIAWAYIGEC
jgi:hypothetical protein